MLDWPPLDTLLASSELSTSTKWNQYVQAVTPSLLAVPEVVAPDWQGDLDTLLNSAGFESAYQGWGAILLSLDTLNGTGLEGYNIQVSLFRQTQVNAKDLDWLYEPTASTAEHLLLGLKRMELAYQPTEHHGQADWALPLGYVCLLAVLAADALKLPLGMRLIAGHHDGDLVHLGQAKAQGFQLDPEWA